MSYTLILVLWLTAPNGRFQDAKVLEGFKSQKACVDAALLLSKQMEVERWTCVQK